VYILISIKTENNKGAIHRIIIIKANVNRNVSKQAFHPT